MTMQVKDLMGKVDRIMDHVACVDSFPRLVLSQILNLVFVLTIST